MAAWNTCSTGRATGQRRGLGSSGRTSWILPFSQYSTPHIHNVQHLAVEAGLHDVRVLGPQELFTCDPANHLLLRLPLCLLKILTCPQLLESTDPSSAKCVHPINYLSNYLVKEKRLCHHLQHLHNCITS